MIGLQVIALVAAGTLAGNELCVSAFIHPRLRALDDGAHAAVAQALARVLGKAMPPWYAATLLLTAAVALSLRHAGTVPFGLAHRRRPVSRHDPLHRHSAGPAQ